MLKKWTVSELSAIQKRWSGSTDVSDFEFVVKVKLDIFIVKE